MNSPGGEISMAGCVSEMVRDPNLIPFFFLFGHDAFLVFTYKKLHAALAMARTKPINQNEKQKQPLFQASTVTETILGAKTACPIIPLGYV